MHNSVKVKQTDIKHMVKWIVQDDLQICPLGKLHFCADQVQNTVSPQGQFQALEHKGTKEGKRKKSHYFHKTGEIYLSAVFSAWRNQFN